MPEMTDIIRGAVRRERWRILQAITDGAIIFDGTDGRVVAVNAAYEHMTGFSAAEIVGNDGVAAAKKTVRPEDVVKIMDAFGAALRGETLPLIETSFINKKDGREVPVLFSVSFLEQVDDDPPLIIAAVKNIAERKRAEERLQRHLRYEQAVALASACLLKHEDGSDKSMMEAIFHLREATAASRAYFFENTDDPVKGLCASLTHEVCAPGVGPEIDNPLFRNMPYSAGMERWRDLLSRGEPVWGDVADFPESERAVLEPQGIFSIAVLPVFGGDRFLGFIGFDQTRDNRSWQQEELSLLKTAADMLGGFMTRARIQEELRRSSERYFGVYEMAPLSFILWDRSYRITGWNIQAEKTFGWKSEEVIGRNFFDILIPDSARSQVEDVVAGLMQGHTPGQSVNENLTKDGRIILCEWNNVIQRGSRNEVAGVLSLALEITERRKTEEERRRFTEALEARVEEYTRELKAANVSLQRTAMQLRNLTEEMIRTEERERKRLATVLHDDLQQLLVAAKMKMHRLAAYKDSPASRQELLELIDKSIKVSRGIVMDLSPPVLWERDLMIGLQWLGRRMFELHRLAVEISGPEECVVSESLNPLIFQAVRELLFNIVKHAGVDRATVEVTPPAGDLIRIVVGDHGRGFSPDASEKFGLFRLRERLGYIGGDIAIETAANSGTRITFTVPLKSSTAAMEPSVVSDDAVNPLRPEAVNASPHRLLVVDDHAVLRQGLVELLEKEDDITVIGLAANGKQAVEKARMLKPDVVLMDISMPVMSGIEATRIIMEEMPGMRVIGLSMHDQAEMRRAMQEAGAAAYVCKGEPIENLVTMIRNV